MLPIHQFAAEIQRAATANERLLLSAPTGSGKSTEVPSLIADLPVINGTTLVIEPRRMAAQLLAEYVANNRKTPVGNGVGYAVRFQSKYTTQTKILFLTDGVFQRILLENPHLHGIAAVIFDEFHERRLSVDIALARCLHLQKNTRPDLRLVVMSATLETSQLATYMAPVREIEAHGRTYPVEISHRAPQPPKNHRSAGNPRQIPVWEQISHQTTHAISQPDPGNILIFLPGTYEIHRTIEVLKNLSCTKPYKILPLYSALTPQAQSLALAPSNSPKIIVSTNVAETSLTIPGVRTVIDSGLARSSAFDPRRSLNTLHITKISRAAAAQRAGRAGRTAPGRCIRLWSHTDHAKRSEFERPEVHRVDLTEACLQLLHAGFLPETFNWLTPPEPTALQKALQLLNELKATDNSQNLTPIGREMATFPVHPRFARLLLAGQQHNCYPETAFIAAVVQGEGLFSKKTTSDPRKDFIFPDDPSDFAGHHRAFESAEAMQFDPRRTSAIGVNARNAKNTAKIFDRLLNLSKTQKNLPPNFTDKQEAVGKSILTAFPDQIAVRLSAGNLACRLSGNRRGKLDDHSSARTAQTFVACEITEVQARETITHLRLATAINLQWIKDIFPNDLHSSEQATYDESRRRVISQSSTSFRGLTLTQKESDANVPLDAAAEILAQQVLANQLTLKNWDHRVEQFTLRLAGISQWMPELGLPTWTHQDRIAAISQICYGSLSYKEIKNIEVWPTLIEWLSPHQKTLLDQYCPEHLRLASGHNAKITYHQNADPVIAVKLAQLVGTHNTPTICNGKTPLLVHILAPNHRPWQMTKDIPNFWQTGYPQMKKELAGRYPRHPWP